MTRTTLLLSAGLTMLASPAFADGTNCPLHARLEAQSVVQTANLTTPAAPVVNTSIMTDTPLSTPPLPLPSPRILPLQSVVPAERGVDNPVLGSEAVLQLAETSYGSATTEVAFAPAGPHADWTAILQKYVSTPDSQGLTHFGYGELKANRADKAKLDNYIKSLEATNPSGLSANEAIAYYANLYNAVTIQVVTDNYPVKSIRNLGAFTRGPWKKDLFQIAGTSTTSLDTVEHGILRKQFPSPYIHYMVNCASVGCPNLLDRAWDADTLEAVRKKAAADYINSPRGVQITSKGLKVSSIYKWFKEDFGGNKEGVLKHIREHANAELAAAIDGGAKISGYDYDWALNK